MVEIKKITYTDNLRQGTDKINSNFDTVVDEIKAVDDRVDTIIVGGGPDKDPELVDIRNLDPSYTPQREINVAGDVTRDMQAQFTAHKAETMRFRGTDSATGITDIDSTSILPGVYRFQAGYTATYQEGIRDKLPFGTTGIFEFWFASNGFYERWTTFDGRQAVRAYSGGWSPWIVTENKMVGSVEITQTGVQFIEFSNLDPSYSGDYVLTAILKNDGESDAQVRLFMNSLSSGNFTGNRLEFDGTTVNAVNSITNIASLAPGHTAFLTSTFGFDKTLNLPYAISEYTDSAGKNASHRCKLTTSTGDTYLRTIRLALITADYAIGSRAILYKR